MAISFYRAIVPLEKELVPIPSKKTLANILELKKKKISDSDYRMIHRKLSTKQPNL